MSQPVDERAAAAALPQQDDAVVPQPLTPEQVSDPEVVDARLPPSSPERRVATLRARAVADRMGIDLTGLDSLDTILGALPYEAALAVLESRQQAMSQFFAAWAKSIEENAALNAAADKAAEQQNSEIRVSHIKQLAAASEMAKAQLERTTDAGEREALTDVIGEIDRLRVSYGLTEEHALNQTPPRHVADATPADRRAGLTLPTGGVRVPSRHV